MSWRILTGAGPRWVGFGLSEDPWATSSAYDSYKDPAFDDSAWSTTTMPFNGSTNVPAVGPDTSGMYYCKAFGRYTFTTATAASVSIAVDTNPQAYIYLDGARVAELNTYWTTSPQTYTASVGAGSHVLAVYWCSQNAIAGYTPPGFLNVSTTVTLTASPSIEAWAAIEGVIGGGTTPGPNLLTDAEATYETGLSTNWQIPPGTGSDFTVTRLSSGHTGSYSMRLSTAAGDPSPLQAMLYRDIAVSPGVTYDFSAWVRPSRILSPFLRVTSFNGSGGYGVATPIDTIGVTPTTASAGTWSFIDASPVVFSAGSVYARILLAEASGASSAPGDTCDFDDVFFGVAGSSGSGAIEVWG